MYYLHRLSYVTEAKIQSPLPIPPAGVLLLLIVKLGQPKCDSSNFIALTISFNFRTSSVDQMRTLHCSPSCSLCTITGIMLCHRQYLHMHAASAYMYIQLSIYIRTHINHILHHHASLIKQTHTNHLCNHPSFQQSSTVIGQDAVKGI